MVSGFLLYCALHQTQAPSRTLICALGKICSPYLLSFFLIFKERQGKASLLLVVVSLFLTCCHTRLSVGWEEQVVCFLHHRGCSTSSSSDMWQECDVPVPVSQRQKSPQHMNRISHFALLCTAKSLTPAGWVSQLQTEWEVPGLALGMEPDTESDTIPQSCPAPKCIAPIKNLHAFPETHLF